MGKVLGKMFALFLLICAFMVGIFIVGTVILKDAFANFILTHEIFAGMICVSIVTWGVILLVLSTAFLVVWIQKEIKNLFSENPRSITLENFFD